MVVSRNPQANRCSALTQVSSHMAHDAVVRSVASQKAFGAPQNHNLTWHRIYISTTETGCCKGSRPSSDEDQHNTGRPSVCNSLSSVELNKLQRHATRLSERQQGASAAVLRGFGPSSRAPLPRPHCPQTLCPLAKPGSISTHLHAYTQSLDLASAKGLGSSRYFHLLLEGAEVDAIHQQWYLGCACPRIVQPATAKTSCDSEP